MPSSTSVPAKARELLDPRWRMRSLPSIVSSRRRPSSEKSTCIAHISSAQAPSDEGQSSAQMARDERTDQARQRQGQAFPGGDHVPVLGIHRAQIRYLRSTHEMILVLQLQWDEAPILLETERAC